MKETMRYEWIRLTTTRGFFVLAATSILGSMLVSWAMTLMIVNIAPDLTMESSIEAATLAATRSPFLLLAAGLLGAFSFGQDRRHGTLFHALLATPNRRILFVAKMATTLTVTTALTAASAAGALAISNLVLGSDNLLQSDPQVMLGCLVLANGWALAGMAAGVLLSRTGAVILLVAGSTLIEPLLGQLAGRIELWGTSGAAFLPFTAGSALISFADPDFAIVLAETAPRLPIWAGATVFFLYIAAALGASFRRVLTTAH